MAHNLTMGQAFVDKNKKSVQEDYIYSDFCVRAGVFARAGTALAWVLWTPRSSQVGFPFAISHGELFLRPECQRHETICVCYEHNPQWSCKMDMT